MNKQNELELLGQAIEEISEIAHKFGLDFYDMRFEICPADILYTFGAYGMPTRFSHWSFGKSFHRMKTSYDYNLSRIYELVVNSDPCYAFLLEGNSLIQNKLVIAHVYAHCDFFKNNFHFRHTNRQMVDSMASSALRISEYEFKYGRKKVEPFIDAVLAIQEHINPNPNLKQNSKPPKQIVSGKVGKYDDLWSLEQRLEQQNDEASKITPALPNPEKDLLFYLMSNAKDLEDWQRDILSIVRDEMIYFWPQIETKIMNEGWASLWHARIIRELDINEDEAVEFAKMHSGVIQPSSTSINPYYLGLKIWENIEQRYHDQIFEVRETESDLSFLRNYLTEDLVEELDIYMYKKVGHQWQIVEKDWEKVRDGLVSNLVNGGFPYIVVVDGDYNRNGDLYLKHMFEGVELDIRYLEKTLPYVYHIWGRQVHLETVVDSKQCLFSYNGEKNIKKIL
ncbi:MAG: SpoVR family protein [Carboxydocellales bacterium]